MAKEADVERVAAALNTPGFRYRSFSNEPVRTQHAPVPPPAAESLPEPEPPEPQLPEPTLDYLPAEAGPSEASPPEAFAEEAVQPEPPPPQQMEDITANPPPATPAGIDWAALSIAAAQQPLPPLLSLAEEAPPPAPPPAPEPPGQPGFSLLSALDAVPAAEAKPVLPSGPPPTTLAALRSLIGQGPNAVESSPLLRSAAGPPEPPAAKGPIPAAAVTVPLGEVMRLITAGSAPAASPFDAFRAALRPHSAS